MIDGAYLPLLNICYDDITSLRLHQEEDRLQRLWVGDSFALLDTRNNYISEVIYNVYNETKRYLQSSEVDSQVHYENILHMLFEYKRSGEITNYAISILIYSETKAKEIFKATSDLVDYEIVGDNIRIYIGNSPSSFGELAIYNMAYDTLHTFYDSALLNSKNMNTEFKDEVTVYNEEQTKVYVLKDGVKMSMQEALSQHYTSVEEDIQGYTVVDKNGRRLKLNKLGRPINHYGVSWRIQRKLG